MGLNMKSILTTILSPFGWLFGLSPHYALDTPDQMLAAALTAPDSVPSYLPALLTYEPENSESEASRVGYTPVWNLSKHTANNQKQGGADVL
jgi:hypothetical protein